MWFVMRGNGGVPECGWAIDAYKIVRVVYSMHASLCEAKSFVQALQPKKVTAFVKGVVSSECPRSSPIQSSSLVDVQKEVDSWVSRTTALRDSCLPITTSVQVPGLPGTSISKVLGKRKSADVPNLAFSPDVVPHAVPAADLSMDAWLDDF